MSVTNDILPFCPNDTGTNLESQSAYLSDSNRTNGNQPGVASSNLNNKAIRQGTYIASQLAQLLANLTNMSVQDNATPAQLLSQMIGALEFIPPETNDLISGTTWNSTFVFIVATPSVNPTASATYTDSGSTVFTVVKTVTLSGGSKAVYATGGVAPATGGAPGTLTKTGGTGDATLTYYAVRAPLWLHGKAVAGGGGGGSGGGTHNVGGDGGTTTFGTSLITCGGGKGGATSTNPNTANSGSSIGAGATGFIFPGGSGGTSMSASGGTTSLGGGQGGDSLLGGGAPAAGTNAGSAAVANSGGGGSGGAAGNNIVGGGGTGGDGIEFIIPSPAATYGYAIGAAGAAATGSVAGGAGGTGRVFLMLHYQ